MLVKGKESEQKLLLTFLAQEDNLKRDCDQSYKKQKKIGIEKYYILPRKDTDNLLDVA